MSSQTLTNYVDDAQRRVAADTLCYQKKGQIVVDLNGITELDPEVIRIEGLFHGATRLTAGSEDDLLCWLSGGQQITGTQINYTFIGRLLYVWPRPTELMLLTAIYKARPPAAASDAELSIGGQFEDMVDRLVRATVMLDTGQTNAAAAALDEYATQAARLRRRAGAKPGYSGRLRRLGQRMR